jgi:hypothetical protein
MSDLYKQFGTDKTYETEGVVLDFGSAKFRVRRAGGSNRKFAAAFTAKTKPHRRAMEAGTLAEDVSARVLMEVYFEAVVIGWEGVTNREGDALGYNLENFVRVMTDLPDLWNTIRAECDNIRNFQAEQVEADAKTLGEA